MNSVRFHEGRGAGKSTTPGGHYEKECLRKNSARGVLLNLGWECFLADFRIVQSHFFHYLHDYTRNHEVPVPFVVRWYQVPGSPFCASLVQSILVRLHVLFPEFSLRHIVATKLPPLRRVIQALLEPFLLFILVNMQIELQYCR